MKAALLKGRADLISAVAERLDCSGNDYAENLVVFPGRRPAHFLRKAISLKHGMPFLPPRICSMDEFIDLICAGLPDASGRKIEPIDAVALLFELHCRAPRPLGRKGFLTLDSFFPIGLKLFRDLEELLIEQVSREAMQQADSLLLDGVPPASLERLQSVSWFYERFYDMIRERSFSTRSLRYCAAAVSYSTVLLPGFSRVILAGLFGLTAAEKGLFSRLGSDSRTCALFQDGPGMKDLLLSLDIEPELIGGDEGGPVFSLYKSPDTHGQTFGLKRELSRAAGTGALDERTVIVLPAADTLFPVLHHAIPTLDDRSFNISMGYPLARTPLFGFFSNLSRIILSMEGDRVYLPDYLTFVLHPYVKNILYQGRADVTRIIFHTLEDAMTAKRTRAFLTLRELEQDRKMLATVCSKVEQVLPGITAEQIESHLARIHDRLVRQFLSPGSLADFSQKTVAVIEYIYEESTAKLHPYFHPFAEAFADAMMDISRSLMKDLAFAETDGYFHFFRKYLATCRVPFPGAPLKGLQVLGLLETRNIAFDRVFILDMNEDVVPGTDREESFLPFKARKALNLPTYLDRDRMAAYHIHTLLGQAKEAHLFSVASSRKEKSRFVEEILWDMQRKDNEIRPDRYVKTVFYDVKLDSNVPSSLPKTPGAVELLRDFEYSASALDTYLTCQLQFYYRYLLRISGREGITGEIEKVDIGRFVHDLLHDFFADRTGRPLTVGDLDAGAMTVMIGKQFGRDYGAPATGSLYLLKKQITDHLVAFLKGYQAAVLDATPVEILELESDLQVTWNGYRLKGRLDRVELRGDALCIIDYKTQSNDGYLRIRHDRLDPDLRETWEDAIGSLQLPFYMLLLSEGRRIPVARIDPLFLLLGRVRLDREIESHLFREGDDRTADYAKLEQVMLGLLKEIIDPEMPFLAARDLKRACPLCDFRNICGTQWIVKKR